MAETYNPTDGMTFKEKLLAGIGLGMITPLRLLARTMGGLSEEDYREATRLDAALLETPEGKAGQYVGLGAAAVGTVAAPTLAVRLGATAAFKEVVAPAAMANINVFGMLGLAQSLHESYGSENNKHGSEVVTTNWRFWREHDIPPSREKDFQVLTCRENVDAQQPVDHTVLATSAAGTVALHALSAGLKAVPGTRLAVSAVEGLKKMGQMGVSYGLWDSATKLAEQEALVQRCEQQLPDLLSKVRKDQEKKDEAFYAQHPELRPPPSSQPGAASTPPDPRAGVSPPPKPAPG